MCKPRNVGCSHAQADKVFHVEHISTFLNSSTQAKVFHVEHSRDIPERMFHVEHFCAKARPETSVSHYRCNNMS